MSYFIVLAAMMLGVAGVIFTRRNQFNILKPVAHVLLWLIVIAGIAGVVSLAYKDDEIRQADRRVQLIEARLQSLALKPFDLARAPAAAKFVIEPEDANRPFNITNFSGPFPSFGQKGRLGRISVVLPNVFAAHAEIFVEADDSIRFTETDATGRALREGEAGSWFRSTERERFAHGTELRPSMPLAKLLAALKANGQEPLGELALDIPNNPKTRTFIALNLERILLTFRFYARQETPYEPCAAAISMPLRFEIEPPESETRLVLSLRIIEREMLAIECGEKLPF
jgi:hypothetical protein